MDYDSYKIILRQLKLDKYIADDIINFIKFQEQYEINKEKYFQVLEQLKYKCFISQLLEVDKFFRYYILEIEYPIISESFILEATNLTKEEINHIKTHWLYYYFYYILGYENDDPRFADSSKDYKIPTIFKWNERKQKYQSFFDLTDDILE